MQGHYEGTVYAIMFTMISYNTDEYSNAIIHGVKMLLI